MRFATVFACVGCASTERFCPSTNDIKKIYGSDASMSNVDIYNQGWTVHGNGGVATKAAFNLNGGTVEFDIDFGNVDTGVNANIYTISPQFSGSEYNDGDHCDGAENDLPWCLEVDWTESNGHCGGATTLHTKPGEGDDGCTAWGCRVNYHFNGVSQYHMKIQYGSDGSWQTYMNGNLLNDWNIQPGGDAWNVIKSAHESTGAVIYSSEWTGWVPVDDCGTSPGDLGGSSFSVSNLVVEGSVVQGPEPTRCSGPQPTPGPTPAPSPTPAGQCQTFFGKNNDGTNLKSTADLTSSADECCTHCAQAPGCVGYTWVHENRECWLKSSVGSPRDDDCGGCVTSGTYSAPAPTPAPSPPTPVPSPAPTPAPSPLPDDCPGGSLANCIKTCPTDAAIFQVCVAECDRRCSSPSCTGGDDGSDLPSCMKNCPSDKYSDCVTCCSDKFPSHLTV